MEEKKLEKKIEEIIEKEIYEVYDTVMFDDVYPAIASEIQSIAIAFAKWLADNGHQIVAVNGKTKDFLFSDFINNHYNK